MKITNVEVTSLKMRLRKPYVWAQGVKEHFIANLVVIEDDSGGCGIGACTTAPDPRALAQVLRHLGTHLIGRSAFECSVLCRTISRPSSRLTEPITLVF